MKSKLSDIEKTFSVVWIILGGIIGAFIAAPIMREKPLIPGLVGLVIGAGIAYAYFRSPRKRKHRRSVNKSTWIGDKFSDILMERILRAYNVRQEPILEKGDDEEASEDELTEVQYDEPKPMFADEPPAGWRETITVFWDSLSLTSKMLAYFSILWPIAFVVINYVFPKSIESWIGPRSIQLLFLLPSCILTGINGLIILFGQNAVDEFEQKPKGIFGYIAAIIALLFSCGASAYLVWVYVLQLEL